MVLEVIELFFYLFIFFVIRLHLFLLVAGARGPPPARVVLASRPVWPRAKVPTAAWLGMWTARERRRLDATQARADGDEGGVAPSGDAGLSPQPGHRAALEAGRASTAEGAWAPGQPGRSPQVGPDRVPELLAATRWSGHSTATATPGSCLCPLLSLRGHLHRAGRPHLHAQPILRSTFQQLLGFCAPLCRFSGDKIFD